MQLQPRERNFTLFIVAIGMLALLALSFASTTWAAPGAQGTVPPGPGPTETPSPQPPPTVTCPVALSGILCAVPGGPFPPGPPPVGTTKYISIPTGAVVTGTVLSITGPLSQPPCPASPSGQTWLDHCFKVDWTGPDGKPTNLLKPVDDCIAYTSGDVAAAGGDPKNLLIGFVYDATTMAWTLLTPTVDAANSRVCAKPDKTFYYQALFTPSPRLPTTGGEPQVSLNWLLLVAAGVVGLLVVGRAVRSARV